MGYHFDIKFKIRFENLVVDSTSHMPQLLMNLTSTIPLSLN